MAKQTYLHGFTKKEQDRLIHQARFLEPYVYSGVDLEFAERLLEVGCGVGAQTKILCRRFPEIKIDAVDLSKEQLTTARSILSSELKSGQVRLFQQDAQKLAMKDAKKYDSAFLCWFLEHVPKPIDVLKRVKGQVKKGGKIYCTEVLNHTLFVEPYSPAYLKYWFEFNDLQWSIKGHPFMGAQLGHVLKEAGFEDIQTEVRTFHFDSRTPERRAAFVDYFFQILLSAEKSLLDAGRITEMQIQQMKAEVEICKHEKSSVFFYSFMRATARVP